MLFLSKIALFIALCKVRKMSMFCVGEVIQANADFMEKARVCQEHLVSRSGNQAYSFYLLFRGSLAMMSYS